MKIIDFERKGNVIRFYLGEETEEWGWTNPNYKDYTGETPKWLKPSKKYYGDDWDDVPYEDNAGTVYEEFVKGTIDLNVPFDYYVFEPVDMNISKDNMRDGNIMTVPCIVITKKSGCFDLTSARRDQKHIAIFYNDEEDKIKQIQDFFNSEEILKGTTYGKK